MRVVCARCKRWVYPGTLLMIIATIKRPPGKSKNYPEACGIYWQPYNKPTPPPLCPGYALVQATVGVGTALIWVLI